MTVAKLVVPIGHCWGSRHEDGPDGGHTNRIRVGSSVVEPTEPEFTVWWAAHGMPDRETGNGERGDDDPSGGDLPRLRDALTGLDWASAAAVDEAVAGLRERRLLVEVDTAPVSAREFAAHHRLVPLVLGLGMSGDADGFAEVGLFGQPMLKLAPALADLWQWAPVSRDLWENCVDSAAVAVEAGLADTAQTDPDNVLHGALGSLHSLLSRRVAAVDERLDGPPATTGKEGRP